MTSGNKSAEPELTVAAGLVRGLLELAVAKGADPAALCARAGLKIADLADVDRRIPLANYVALMRAGQDLAGDPALALHYGESNDMSEVSVVGLIAYACETMLEALAQINRYGRLVVEVDCPGNRFSVTRKDAGLWAVDRRDNPNAFPELTESTFARAICAPLRREPARQGGACHAPGAGPSRRI